jgi:hypothetical protein
MKNTTLIAAILTALAACTEPAAPHWYPTVVYQTTMSDGRQATLYGAEITDVCLAIADAACQEDVPCSYDFYAHCNPGHGQGSSQIMAGSLIGWDELWVDCFDATADLPRDYAGKTTIHGCEKLTPYWTGS